MAEMSFEIFRHISTLLFGVFVSAAFLRIGAERRSVLLLGAFSLLDFLLQGILYLKKNVALITMIYPLITHLPLLLFFVFGFKKKAFPSVLAITTAYL